MGVLEPLTLLSALAGATDHIGLTATASTSCHSPYNLARKPASLDHVSGGPAGGNIVTTARPEAARNFGLGAQASHAQRYPRAMGFVNVVRQHVVLAVHDLDVGRDNAKAPLVPHARRARALRPDCRAQVPRAPQASTWPPVTSSVTPAPASGAAGA